MKKSIPTDLTSANIASVLDILAASSARLEALSKSISANKRNQPLGEGERSFIETLAHLVNSEARNSEAIYLALLVDEPLMVNVHSERDWGKLLRYDLLDFNELLAYFNLRRAVLMRVLSGLKEAQWSRSIREEGKQRKETVYWRARSLAVHEAEHLEDLENKLKQMGHSL